MAASPGTTERWELPAFGRENLIRREVPRPVPKPNEALVAVEAVSLNYRDFRILNNNLGPGYNVPLVPGSDIAGTVLEVGANVRRVRTGDRVVSNDITGWVDGAAPTLETNSVTMAGRLARHIVIDAELLVSAPTHLSTHEASTLPTAGLTAWMAIVELGKVNAAQTIVVQGTGGVALFATQFALAHGARVIVTTTSEEKIARLGALGRVEAINRRLYPEWHEKVRELTGPRGADHIIEMAGGDNIERSLQALAFGGRISMVGLQEDDRLGGSSGQLFYKRATIAGTRRRTAAGARGSGSRRRPNRAQAGHRQDLRFRRRASCVRPPGKRGIR